ncbi:MAG: alpha/beta fold hydrolase [Candidatus Heimdallarchaeota archaeon]
MTELFADVNGIKICYEIQGEGDPLFLIHGFASKKESWLPQFGPLSKHFKVIRYDNRGSGASDRPDQPYTMELFADDLNELMIFLKIEKAHIIGQSFGGMIAQHFAVRYPSRVKKLILINTIAKWPENKSGLNVYLDGQIDKYNNRLNDPVKAFFDSAPSGYTLKFRKMMKEDMKKKFFGLFSTEDLIKDTTFRPATPKDIRNQGYALGNHNILDRLHGIKNETLIICAEKDKQMPKAVNLQIYERIPNSKFIVIEKAGHGSPKEKAPEVNQNIINFLKS